MVDRSVVAVPRLHVLVDVRAGDEPLPFVDAVLAAGAPLLQLRAKGLLDREHTALACDVAARCAEAGAVLVVNDRVDVAAVAGADGVHLGADDLPLPAVRALLDRAVRGSERPLLGGTARDAADAVRHERSGADYLGVGPCYPTGSKAGLPAPGGPQRIADVAAATELPLIAIAGVTAARVPELLEAGAHGVAVIAAVADAPDPGAAVHELLSALGELP